MKTIAAPMLLLSLFGFAAESRANFIPVLTVDRSQQTFDQYLFFSPMGESFTPSLPGIQWVAFGMQDQTRNPTQSGVFNVELFQGIGSSGTLLATSNNKALPPGFGGVGFGAYAYFFFPGEVAPTPGSPYTLMLNHLSGETISVLVAGVSQIGNEAILTGQPQKNFNLAFGEGLGTLSVPEPPSLILLCIAALGIPFVIYRTRSIGERAS